jgi:DNA topoisomerase-1
MTRKTPSPLTRRTVKAGTARKASKRTARRGATDSSPPAAPSARGASRARARGRSGSAAASPNGKGRSRTLLIVESPAKARTIKKYVGSAYDVKASVGHVRDLPQKKLGVDVEADFAPTYETIPKKQKIVRELRAAARKADSVVMATDPDREGEAIAWHVAEELAMPADRIRRAVFHEVTRPAVLEALRNPTVIDSNKVNAQQARRILDRLVGYQVSPLLWKIFYPGLSAGRVQTVALRLICEREEEIDRFTPVEYWTIAALLESAGREFEAELFKLDGADPVIPSEEAAGEILGAVRGKPFVVAAVDQKERRRNPYPPFITSTLQQDASRRFGFGARKTMRLAQELYEGLEIGGEGAVGLITYMRTDSTRLSSLAIDQARSYIGEAFGAAYLPDQPRQFKSGKGAQDAHEAIRPTEVARRPEDVRGDLTPDQLKLYQTIWQRFVASQMMPALYDQTTADFFPTPRHQFRARGSVLKFPGFVKVYDEALSEGAKPDEAELPVLAAGQEADVKDLTRTQHFTQPPPRFSEATLVKELEADGIGRPSTYAAIISTLLDRDYVRLDRRRLVPTLLGREVLKTLVHNLEDIFNVEFTSEMEDELDKVEDGELDWVDAVRDFYRRFQPHVTRSRKLALPPGVFRSDQICDRCGSPMVIKWTKRGPFLGCSAYPECRNTKPIFAPGQEPDLDERCPRCGAELAARSGRFGPFLACTNAPDCSYTRSLKQGAEDEPGGEAATDQPCPNCGSPMVIRTGKFGRFIACSNYPACKTTKPIGLGIPCPKDGGELVERRTRRGKIFYGCANYPACDFATWNRPVSIDCPSCHGKVGEEGSSKKTGPFVRCLSCRTLLPPRLEHREEDEEPSRATVTGAGA